MIERMRRLVADLSARERLLVAAAIAAGAIVAILVGVVEPLAAARQASTVRLADRLEVLEWVAARTSEARALRESLGGDGTAPATEAATIAEIEASLDTRGLRPALTRLAPGPDGQFEARFEDVAYTALIGWLAESSRRAGVTVTRIFIEATDRPDRVDAELFAAMRGGRRVR